MIYREAPIPKANNLKVTIGASELVSCNENQSSETNNLKVTIGALKIVVRIIPHSGGRYALDFVNLFTQRRILMKVILKQSLPSLGKAGNLVKVNDGYARNFLIPKGLAIEADEKNIKLFEHEKTNILRKSAKENKLATDLADVLSRETITIARKVGDQDKIFGSVSAKDIESALKEKGYDINRKMIVHEHGEHIKALGEFKVKIRLAHDVETQIKLNVVGEY